MKLIGVAQWIACWAHNPNAGGCTQRSKDRDLPPIAAYGGGAGAAAPSAVERIFLPERSRDRNTVGLGGRVVLALRLTALMAVGRFETYHHPLELAVARELPASRYVSQGMSSS